MKPEGCEAVDRKSNQVRGYCNLGEKAEPSTRSDGGGKNVQEGHLECLEIGEPAGTERKRMKKCVGTS